LHHSGEKSGVKEKAKPLLTSLYSISLHRQINTIPDVELNSNKYRESGFISHN
jgi:hypothetical protein